MQLSLRALLKLSPTISPKARSAKLKLRLSHTRKPIGGTIPQLLQCVSVSFLRVFHPTNFPHLVSFPLEWEIGRMFGYAQTDVCRSVYVVDFFPKLPQVGVGSFLFYDLPKPFRFEWWSYLRFTLVWTLCGYECGGTFILAPSETPSKCSGYLGQHPFRWWSFFFWEREKKHSNKKVQRKQTAPGSINWNDDDGVAFLWHWQLFCWGQSGLTW